MNSSVINLWFILLRLDAYHSQGTPHWRSGIPGLHKNCFIVGFEKVIGKDHTVEKVIGKDHTVEKVIGKDHTVEKVSTEVECETEGFRDHKAPAVIENVIVKVECEAGSAREHNAPEVKVKVREPEAKESNLVKIHESVANDNMIVKVRRPEANANEKKMEHSLQNRQYSDKVKRESPETTTIEESNCNERIDIGRTDTEGSPVREKALEIGKMDVPSIEHRGDNQMKDDNRNGDEEAFLPTDSIMIINIKSTDRRAIQI
ncbi:hypothetical protein PRIPAC_96770 [Pristionchus pacificus]|uniref:Uncharacterized protein n=1 Tax=Pristionchus pacificus TaxID=54126 RepID=A0A2A6BC02_PRIPA|nr:hypothetical protein PRIPAC_96770 [Pristionchus pacificus]|eukprot:PDM63398.1 hypothetical protein PRIPAC_53755 [Pristionchus pacificus]